MRRERTLLIIGLGFVLALTGLSLVFVNVPAGYDVRYGLSLDSVDLFGWLPNFDLTPAWYTGLGLGLFGACWGFYFLGLRHLSRARGEKSSFTAVIGISVALVLVMLWVLPPVLSSDVYEYAFYGRTIAVYGESPFAVSPSSFPKDPLLNLVAWPDETSRYGPIWVAVCACVAALGGANTVTLVLLFKLIGGLSLLTLAWAIASFAKHIWGTTEGPLFWLVACNPLLLIESAGSAHADIFMMACALLGVLLFAKGHRWFGVFLLIFSILTKYLTLLLLVLLLLSSRLAKGFIAKNSWTRWIVASIGMGVLIFASLVIFERLPFSIPGRPELSSCPNVFRVFLDQGIGAVFAKGATTSALQMNTMRVLHILFLVGFSVLGARYIFKEISLPNVLRDFGWLSLIYILFIYGGGYPWYMIIPIAAGAVGVTQGKKRLWLWANGIGFAEMMLYLFLIPA